MVDLKLRGFIKRIILQTQDYDLFWDYNDDNCIFNGTTQFIYQTKCNPTNRIPKSIIQEFLNLVPKN